MPNNNVIDFVQLANPSIQTLKAYQPGKPIEEVERELGITNIIKLASNENPLGPSPKALIAAEKALKKMDLYPDASGYHLKNRLASRLNIPVSHITLGNGSDSLLSLLIQAYGKEKAILISDFSFDNYAIIARGHNVGVQTATSKNWGVDVQAMIHAITDKTAIIFIANPNNPTGTYIHHDDFLTLLKNTPPHVLIVSDEAYHEYVTESNYPKTLELQKLYPNLIITRTFSKAYGLAGMRVGYAISNPVIADILNRIRLPFNVSTPGMAAACAALDDDDFLCQTTELNQQGKIYWMKACAELNINVIPSSTNFVTLDFKTDTQPIFQKLLQMGIIVRPLHTYQMPHHLRITIGTDEQNKRAVAALREIL